MDAKKNLIRLAGEDCPDKVVCPSAWATEEDYKEVYVVGAVVDDPDILTKAGPGEAVVRVPRDVWEARR